MNLRRCRFEILNKKYVSNLFRTTNFIKFVFLIVLCARASGKFINLYLCLYGFEKLELEVVDSTNRPYLIFIINGEFL